jgi:hypothetical protein
VLNGGTLTSPFLLSGSTLSGTDHTFQGASTWTGGTITGAASTTFGDALTISGANAKTLSGGRTVNAGDTTWTGNTGGNNNSINISGAAIFNSTGTFTDTNAFDSIINVGNGGGTFNNIGTFNKESATTTTIGTAFNNTGTVNVNAGTFLPGGGGTDTGTFNIADGAKLELRNGSHTLNNVTIDGDGLFQISTDNVGADASVVLNGGTLTSPFLLSGSTLSGTDHTFQGASTWTGGTITGASSTTFGSTLAISGTGTKVINGGRTVNTAGDTTWSGNTAANNNAISIAGAGILNNTGIFTDANAFDSTISTGNGGGTFNNSGTFNKQSNTTTALTVAYHNTGTTNVNAGTMRVSTAFTNQGTITVDSGATFFVANATFANQGLVQGNGTYQTNSATTILNNSGTISPGVGDVGTLTVAGDYTQTAAGIFDVQLASLSSNDLLNVLGDVNLMSDSMLRVLSYNNFNPMNGDTFTIVHFDDGVADASDLTGIFGNITWSGFNPDVSFTAEYFAHDIVLTASVSPSTVPVPPAAWLFGSGLLGLVGIARRREIAR